MATLKTNTLTGTSTAGSIAVTGEGNSTTTNLQQGLAKHWVNYDAVEQATRGSFNQASLTDSAAGDFTSNYTNNLSGAEDKCISVSAWDTIDNGSTRNSSSTRGGANADQAGDTAQSTSSINFMCYFGSSAGADGGNVDHDSNYCITHGDLA